MDIEQHGARGVGRVAGMNLPAGQPPQQEGIDGADGQIAGFGFLSCAGDVLHQPGDLAGGEIRIEQKAGYLLHQRAMARLFQLLAECRTPAILPDDGIVQRLARCPVPQHGRLALIGDADGGDIGNLGQHLAADGQRGAPDLLGIVFDPAIGREDLRQFLLCDGQNMSVLVEDHGPRARRSLVDRQNAAAGHAGPLSRDGGMIG